MGKKRRVIDNDCRAAAAPAGGQVRLECQIKVAGRGAPNVTEDAKIRQARSPQKVNRRVADFREHVPDASLETCVGLRLSRVGLGLLGLQCRCGVCLCFELRARTLCEEWLGSDAEQRNRPAAES